MENKQIIKALFWSSLGIIFFATGLFIFGIFIVFQSIKPPTIQTELKITKQTSSLWQSPDIKHINQGRRTLVEYGKELIVHTAKYFGVKGIIGTSTNGMNCQNCHLEAGTKAFGNNYGLVASTYPKYRARSGTIENIEKRINDCFERSLNGKPLNSNSREMQAIKAYILFIGSNVSKDNEKNYKGLSMKDNQIKFLDRLASPKKGKLVYEQKCQSCHQPNGEGVWNADKTEFIYPPLWGKNSYNDAAGLYRISNFAKFVKYNMPLGANHENILLSDEEAWDVAAFVNSNPRPHKDNSKDWPKIHEKPFDHPFGPFADPFPENQHKYGPFPPIQAYYAKNNKK